MGYLVVFWPAEDESVAKLNVEEILHCGNKVSLCDESFINYGLAEVHEVVCVKNRTVESTLAPDIAQRAQALSGGDGNHEILSSLQKIVDKERTEFAVSLHKSE